MLVEWNKEVREMKAEKGSFMGEYDLEAAWQNLELRQLDQLLGPTKPKKSHKVTAALTQKQYRQELKQKKNEQEDQKQIDSKLEIKEKMDDM